ncbi:MAG TPA: hypothetical protein VHO69_17660 [Phototrophicaceae bacterium]|nr:hypothetical protein [Phototrophicaceae bacterium]
MNDHKTLKRLLAFLIMFSIPTIPFLCRFLGITDIEHGAEMREVLNQYWHIRNAVGNGQAPVTTLNEVAEGNNLEWIKSVLTENNVSVFWEGTVENVNRIMDYTSQCAVVSTEIKYISRDRSDTQTVIYTLQKIDGKWKVWYEEPAAIWTWATTCNSYRVSETQSPAAETR